MCVSYTRNYWRIYCAQFICVYDFQLYSVMMLVSSSLLSFIVFGLFLFPSLHMCLISSIHLNKNYFIDLCSMWYPHIHRTKFIVCIIPSPYSQCIHHRYLLRTFVDCICEWFMFSFGFSWTNRRRIKMRTIVLKMFSKNETARARQQPKKNTRLLFKAKR